MKLIMSNALIANTGDLTREIAACFDLDVPANDASGIVPVDTKHYMVRHVGNAVEIELSDESLIRAAQLYLSIAKFIAPIIKQCLAFHTSFKAELDEFQHWLENDDA
jgi:hypothetical protein